MAIDAHDRRRLRPTAGARLLLDLIAVDGAAARYAAWVLTPDGEHGFAAILDDTGAATLTALPADERDAASDAAKAAGATGGEAAAASGAHDDLLMLGRLTARGAARRAADGLPAWPPRVLRWRGPGRGA